MVMPNGKKKSHKKRFETQLPKHRMLKTQTYAYRESESFLSNSSANLSWKYPPDIFLRADTKQWCESLTIFKVAKYTCLFTTIWIYMCVYIYNIKDGKQMISVTNLFLQSWSSACWTVLWTYLHFKGEENRFKEFKKPTFKTF